jgi:ABC-type branched-subunit amino acid transport system substrate-binding protein
MIDCLTPASLKVSNMLDAAITIAIVPNASGASILARSIFRANLKVRSTPVAAPNIAAPRVPRAFRLLPRNRLATLEIVSLILRTSKPAFPGFAQSKDNVSAVKVEALRISLIYVRLD